MTRECAAGHVEPTMAPRCAHTWLPDGIGACCCRELGHEGEHRYRCRAPDCPGYPLPASEMVHPCNPDEPIS